MKHHRLTTTEHQPIQPVCIISSFNIKQIFPFRNASKLGYHPNVPFVD